MNSDKTSTNHIAHKCLGKSFTKQTNAVEMCASVTQKKKTCVYFVKVTQGAVVLLLVGAR